MHILYHRKAEAVQIPAVIEIIHLTEHSSNYGYVDTAHPLKTIQLLRFSVIFALHRWLFLQI